MREDNNLKRNRKALTCSTRRFRISLVYDCCSGQEIRELEVAARPLESLSANGSSVDSSSMRCQVDSEKCQNTVYNKFDEQLRNFSNKDARYSYYIVSELAERDFSRNVVEIICQSSWLKSKINCAQIQTVLKVHCGQEILAQFEQHRELVKHKARGSQKKHPRVMADGNELRQFYGTNISCSFGLDGSLEICKSDICCLCRILRHGFYSKKEFIGGLGILTCSTSKRAFDSVAIQEEEQSVRKAVIICRVIAGRICKPFDYPQKGFHSLVGKVDSGGNIEDLYLPSPSAILPCFVVIFRS